MAVDTSKYARRKRDADARIGFQVESASDLSRALSEIDDDIVARRKAREAEARQGRLDAENTENTRYERSRNAVLDMQKRADKAAIEETTRTDRDAIAQDRLAQKEGRDLDNENKRLKQASDELAGRARGGASFEALQRIAMDDPRMGSVDDDFVKSIRDGSLEAQRAEREKIDAQLRLINERADAASRDKRKGSGGLTAQQLKDREAKSRKLQADADAAEARARALKGKGEGDPTGNVKAAEKLRKEYNALGPVKAALDAQASYETMVNASTDPSAAGDLSLIFSFMKVLDPGSVVKETEFANAQNAAGVPDRIRNSFNKVLSGERLSEGQRRDFLKQAKGLADKAAERAAAETERYSGIAERSGFSPQDVVRGAKAKEPAPVAPAAPPTTAIDDELAAVAKEKAALDARLKELGVTE